MFTRGGTPAATRKQPANIARPGPLRLLLLGGAGERNKRGTGADKIPGLGPDARAGGHLPGNSRIQPPDGLALIPAFSHWEKAGMRV